MFKSTDFTFDGINGTDFYGLKLVRTEQGLNQPFGLSRKSITDTAKNRYRVYHYGFKNEVLSFNLKFFKDGVWTYEQRVAISKWLIRDTYKDFESTDYPLVFKIIAVSQPVFTNYGNDQGYLEINFESDAPFCYSPISVSSYDLSNNPVAGTIITMENKSNVFDTYRPELEFTVINGSSVKLVNQSNRNKVFEFTGLTVGEKIYVNNETGRIVSTLSETRLSNLTNHQFFEMVYGQNRIRAYGQISVETRMQFPMMV